MQRRLYTSGLYGYKLWRWSSDHWTPEKKYCNHSAFYKKRKKKYVRQKIRPTRSTQVELWAQIVFYANSRVIPETRWYKIERGFSPTGQWRNVSIFITLDGYNLDEERSANQKRAFWKINQSQSKKLLGTQVLIVHEELTWSGFLCSSFRAVFRWGWCLVLR